MSKYPILIFTILLFAASGFCQDQFKPGSYVQKNGDTVIGFIAYQDLDKNPETFRFKKDTSSAVETIALGDVKTFTINSNHSYVAAVVVKDMLTIKFDQVKFGVNERDVIDTVFLKVLVRGEKLSLYHLYDTKDHFYISDGKELTGLQYKLIKKDPDRQVNFTNDNFDVIVHYTFRDQLKRYAIGNKKLLNRIDRAIYTIPDLSKVVRLINQQ